MEQPATTPPLSDRSARASLLTVSVVLVFAAVLMIVSQFVSLRKSMVDNLTVQSNIVAENSSAAVVFRDAKACEDILDSLHASQPVHAAAVFANDGSLLGQYAPANTAHQMETPSSALLKSGHEFTISELQVATPIKADGKVVGAVVLHASLDDMYERLLGSALITMSIVLVSLGFAYFLVTRMRRMVSQAEAHLTYLAHVDSVTGLPNRHAFNERLPHALSKIKRFGGTLQLLLLDLDNFKIVNDTLGHNNGDQLLKQVAERLHATLREADVICRIGGDEFAIILESASTTSAATAVAEKIIAALSVPCQVGQHEIYVTGSIGVSSCPEDGVDLPTLTRCADTAMYQAKALGKNTYAVFRQEMDQCAQKRLSLETNLRKAIERDEITLHYQPKISLSDQSVIGFEALLRWQHPELGMISPAEFIPVAEESGLIVPIGRWILQTACKDMAAWRDAGHGDVNVAINLSVRQTRDPHLREDIRSALQTYGIQAGQLSLEITESVLMENIESNISMLEHLRSDGVRLSIDDFGTGYSSMAYLKRFHIDELKIDRAFIRDIPGDGEDEAIVTAVVALAHGLGLSVVAEGVETEEQHAFLRSVRCDSVQGYYFSRPVSFAAATAYLQQSAGNEAEGAYASAG